MSYPRIMKGETLLGFEIGTEASPLPTSPSSLCLHLAFREQHKHFHLGGSSTGLLISRYFE